MSEAAVEFTGANLECFHMGLFDPHQSSFPLGLSAVKAHWTKQVNR